jgi:hypothetical protein
MSTWNGTLFQRRLLAFTIVLLIGQLLLPLANLQPNVSAVPITKVNAFADKTLSKDIVFTDAGTDTTTAKLSFQTGVNISNAGMLVDGIPRQGSNPSNITIDFGGDGDAEWRWSGLGYGQMGHQDLFVLDGKAQNATANLTIVGGGGNNNSASIRLPYGAKVTNATMVVGVKGISIAIECKTGSRSCDTLNNDAVYSLKDVFTAQGWTSKIVTGTDIDTVAELSQYTVVILGNPGYSGDSDYTVFQSALKTWVTTYGGGMVGTGWLLYATTAGSDMEYLLPVNTPYTSTTGMVTITNGAHPVTQGVNSFNLPASTYCERPSSGTVDAGATTLGTCGGPTLVVSEKGAGRTVYLGPNYFGDYQTYGSKQFLIDADPKLLMQQAALWASGGGSLSGFIDVGNDGTNEWAKTNYNGSEGLNDFTGPLNTYLASAQPSFTDPYGNKFVDIPIKVNSTSAGLISLQNLTVSYDYTAKIDQNPHNSSLSNEIYGLISDKIGTNNVTIPIYVTSDTAGIVRLHAFNADLIDPDHAPVITAVVPELAKVDMDENTTTSFKVTAVDWYRYPLTYAWFLDDKQNVTGDSYNYYASFESFGEHNITVKVSNGILATNYSWTVIVKNVNRPPLILSYDPALSVLMDENTTKTFTLMAQDPDKGDRVGFVWTMDGVGVGSTGNTYDYKAGFKDAGTHTLLVTAKDPRALTAQLTWDITVTDVNAPPEIYNWGPKTEPTMAENSSLQFMIKTRSPDDDPLTAQWQVDGKDVKGATGTNYEYKTGFEDAGVREVKVLVTDGTLTVSHTWKVTVTDVNRPPYAKIFSPKEGTEFLTTDNITLSAKGSSDPDKDKLTYDWYKGGTKIATGENATVKLPKGHISLELLVMDGRDGQASTTVSFYVEELKFEITLSPDNSAPRDGDTVKFTVQVHSLGDADGDRLPVLLYIDGTMVGNQTIDTILSEDTQTITFEWKAKEGNHKVLVVVAQDKAEKSLTVQKALIPGVGGSTAVWLLPMLLIIVVVGVLAGVGIAVSRRKKKAAAALPTAAPVQPAPVQVAPSEQYNTYQAPVASPPPMAQVYRPYEGQSALQPQPSPPPSSYYSQPAEPVYAMATPVYIPPNAYEQPAVQPEPYGVGSGYTSDLEATEAAVNAAASSGKDVTRARNHLRLAKFFNNKGDMQKTNDYCRKANEAIQ